MLNHDYREMLSCLLDAEVDFIIVGAYALAAHGRVRATVDLDIWIDNVIGNCQRTLAALARFGAPLGAITVDDLARADTVVQIGVEPTRVDVLSGIDGVAFAAAREHCLMVEIDGLEVRVLSRQDLLASKLAAGRDQDLGDIAWLRRNP